MGLFCGQDCGCWWLGAWAPGHQQPQDWLIDHVYDPRLHVRVQHPTDDEKKNHYQSQVSLSDDEHNERYRYIFHTCILI